MVWETQLYSLNVLEKLIYTGLFFMQRHFKSPCLCKAWFGACVTWRVTVQRLVCVHIQYSVCQSDRGWIILICPLVMNMTISLVSYKDHWKLLGLGGRMDLGRGESTCLWRNGKGCRYPTSLSPALLKHSGLRTSNYWWPKRTDIYKY